MASLLYSSRTYWPGQDEVCPAKDEKESRPVPYRTCHPSVLFSLFVLPKDEKDEKDGGVTFLMKGYYCEPVWDDRRNTHLAKA